MALGDARHPMGLDEAVTAPRPRLVAGIGFRRGATAGEILALIRQALSEAGADHLAGLATALDRAEDPALREAAAAFGLVPTGIASAALVAQDARVLTRSARIQTLRGVGSLCEAAALAGAGPGGRLALPRISTGSVTCALAFATETHEKPQG
jgi:cobalt-precorrin 5A hydrolase